MTTHEAFMRRALELARENIDNGGGPFGAVVVRDGRIVGEGCNRVTAANDPTAHAEVLAIRAACGKLEDFSLVGCDIYASCEPCPMCLAAILWARVDRVFYANTREDAARAGFDDAVFYEELERPPAQRRTPTERLLLPGATDALDAWRDKDDRISY